MIRVEYKYESDPDEKYQELVREVGSLRGTLPAEIFSVDINKFQPSDVNIVQVALISENASRTKLKYFSEKLKEQLEKISVLKNIEVHGLPEQVCTSSYSLILIKALKNLFYSNTECWGGG